MAATILIVEDNELSMMLLISVLRSRDYETIQSADGSDVLEIARERHPDLIVMDIQLPVRSGFELVGELKAEEALRDIPVIAVTAFAAPEDEARIRAAGSDDYVVKPIRVIAFLETVARHLSRASAPAR